METMPETTTISKNKTINTTSLVTVAAENVYNHLGSGYDVRIYQRAIGLELDAFKIPYSRDLKIDLVYRQQPIGQKEVDFVVDDLMVLVRAQGCLDVQDEIQASTFLRATTCKAVLVLNFGGNRFEFRHIQPTEYADY